MFYTSDKRVGATLENFPRERTWLLPALQAVQEEEGWLSLPSLEAVSAYLRVPKSEVYGVATHYPEFRLTKPGAQIVRVCTGVSCRLLGGVELLGRVRERFANAGETSSDGHVTLEEADCFFLCSMAPLVEVDRRCFGRVGPADLDRLFKPSPARRASRATSLLSKPSGDSPLAALEQLRAQSRTHRSPHLRLLVGVGSCSESVGADLLLDRLADEVRRQKLSAVVSETGCSGMCYAAPVVEILHHDGWPRITLKGVTVEDVAPLLSALKFDRLPPGIEAVAWQGEPWGFIPGLNREPFLKGQRRALLERVGRLHPDSVAEALREGSYHALARALERGDPTALIEEVKASGLQGRGGAYFAAALKWEACRAAAGSPKYLVVNGEEGEPGIFKDRHLMEGDPHRFLEGILLAAFSAGTSRGVLYVHGEAHLAATRMQTALRSAEAAGLLGERILGSDFSFHLEIRRGAGGFVLGEETALLESIEGKRAMPRTRPPFPVEAGLWGKPTVINNVETLSAVPLIADRGAGWFRALGGGRGTKLFGLSGSVVRPGIVEVEMGVTLRRLIDEIGGGSRDGTPLRAALVGGPSGVVVHSGKFDEPMTPGGALSPGTGGVVALGADASIRDVVRTLLAFNARESCGKCTPCREGTARLLEWLDGKRPEAGVSRAPGEAGSGVPADLRDLTEVVRAASLCGLGQAAPLSLLSALESFPEEMWNEE